MTKTIEEKIDTILDPILNFSPRGPMTGDQIRLEAKQALLTLICEVGEEVIGEYQTYPLDEITTTYAKVIDARNSLWKEQRSRLNKLVGDLK